MTDKTQHMSPEEFRRQAGLDPVQKRSNKMNAQRTTRNGINYSSKLEARYVDTLNLLKQEKYILGYAQQVSIPLAQGAKNRFRLDFLVIHRQLDNGHFEVSFEDTTGFKTDKKKLNVSMMESQYGIKVELK